MIKIHSYGLLALLSGLTCTIGQLAQFSTVSIVETTTTTDQVTTSTNTIFTGEPVTATTTFTVSGTSIVVIGGTTSTVLIPTFLSPTTSILTSTSEIVQTETITVTTSAPKPIPSTGPAPVCGLADNCLTGQTICVTPTDAQCAAGGCEPGFYADGTDGGPGPCTSCTIYGDTCLACDSEQCLDCSPGFSTDSQTGICFSCSKFGSQCNNCTELACIDCVQGAYLDFANRCKECVASPGCPSNKTTCTDNTFSSCLQGQCSAGYFNSLLLANSTCVECAPALGCRPGFSRCSGDGSASICQTDQCLPYWYNALDFENPYPPAIVPVTSNLQNESACALLQVTFETDLGESFILDVKAQIDWLDSLAESLISDTNSGARTKWWYPIYYQRIYSNEDRNNLTDIGLVFPSADIPPLQVLFQQDDIRLRRIGINCLVIPVFPDRPYGVYQRPLCLGCAPIENCLEVNQVDSVSCDGNPEVSQCAICELGYYLISGKMLVSDRCEPCPPAYKCNSGFTRCAATEEELLDESSCVAGECRESYYDLPYANTTELSIIYTSDTETAVLCVACPKSYGCKNRESSICVLTNAPVLGTEFIPTFTSTCLSGMCEKPYYNYVGECVVNADITPDRSCAPDNSPCALADLTIQIPYDWSNVTKEVIIEFENMLVLTFGVTQGSLNLYPWSVFVEGIRQNKTSGLILVDVALPLTNKVQLLLDAATDPAPVALAASGAMIVSAPSDCVTASYDTVPHNLRLYCVEISNCEPGNVTCEWGSYAARCEQCSDGYYNNKSIGYYPDQCVECPAARNCTVGSTLGNTVCTCPTDSECISGACEYGYWNNPYVPELDCGFNNSYSCWPEDILRRAVRGKLLVDTTMNNGLEVINPFDTDLWSAYLYGLHRVNPFHTCPKYGINRKSTKEERRSGFNVGFWAYNSSGEFWIDYYEKAVVDLQHDDKFTKTCGPRPKPEFSSPCRRWIECDEDEFEAVYPTGINDRVCRKCSECNHGTQYRALNCTQFTDTVCVNCLGPFDCPIGTYMSCPCTGLAQSVCTDCTAITGCELEFCTTATDSVCLYCTSGSYYLNRTTNLCTICSSNNCTTNEYFTECTAEADAFCTQCPLPEHCVGASVWTCTGNRDSICAVGDCEEGYTNDAVDRTCHVLGTDYTELPFEQKLVQINYEQDNYIHDISNSEVVDK
eukprot:CFRG6093T1